jgi:cytochrome P450
MQRREFALVRALRRPAAEKRRVRAESVAGGGPPESTGAMPGTEFDPFGGPMLADPYPDFARLVADRPVFLAPELGHRVVSRHADCRQVLRDHETFSASNTLSPVLPPCPAAGAALAAGGFRSIPTLTNVDPPAHTRTRRIAHLAFTPRRVLQREPLVRDLVRRFIASQGASGTASQGASGTVDIVRALTYELPALVVFDVLGIPAADVDAIKEGSANRLLFMFGRSDEATQVRTAEGMAAFWRYCEALAEDRRANPRDDFTSDIVHHLDESGHPLDQQEVATILFGLLLAGHETTTNILGNGLRRLLSHRDAWAAISADPELVPNAVEEVLRYDSSVVHWRRRTTRPVTLSGVDIPAGADVLVCIGAANRDPAVFADPDTFDIRRANARDHLSFGGGAHLCLGAPLARLEARVVLTELAAAWPDLRLVEGQELEFMPIIGFRGPRALLVEWGRPPADGRGRASVV